MTLPLVGQETPRSNRSTNQQTADTIVARLRQSGQLRQYNIEVDYHDGTVDLKGVVADQSQRAAVARIVASVPGVRRIRDALQVQDGVMQAQAIEPPTLPEPNTLPAAPGLIPPPGMPPGQVPPMPGMMPGTGEPMPVWQAPPPNPYELNPPKMPPYAWPTYAPYNNYSRVAYPELYPYNAWPFIGPIYPFPKVPPGWRKVSLEWQDGYWWYAPHSNSHDWWRLRYW
jgi:hypothetical protein